jgi:hypothetical protein
VSVDTELNIAAGAPDPTVSGNNLDHDIIFSLKPTSTALSTDALPSSIDLNDFDSVTGAFSSFSLANGPAGDPIFYKIDTLSLRAVSIDVTYLATGWKKTDFLTLDTPTRAIAFDSSDNLYIENTNDDNSGTIEVLQLSSASGYKDLSSYLAYPSTYNAITYKGVTGLGFDSIGSLYVAERDTTGDAGIVRVIDVATKTLSGTVMSFANHRPTGIDADTSGNIYYSGRKDSDGTWGKIFKIDNNVVPAERTELILNTVATGIAVDTLGNIFISTPERTDLPLLSNSIYRFAISDLNNPELIATFNARGGELTFDKAGNLYMVADDKLNIIKLTKASGRAMPWLPILLE